MATDKRTLVDATQDPGLGNQSVALPQGTEVKTVVINYTEPPLYGVPQLQIFNDPGGSGGQVQFNNGSGFGGTNNFVWNGKTNTVGVRGNLTVTGNIAGKITTNPNNFKLYGGINGQVLSTDGTGNLSWVTQSGGNANIGNIGFRDNVMYSLNGLYIDNSDLTHGATAALAIPSNGVGNIELNNLYGNTLIQSGTSGTFTATWNFDNNGNLTLPGNTFAVNYANGVPVSIGVPETTGIGTFSTLPDFLEFDTPTQLRTGQNSEGIFFSGDAGPESVSYPVRTNFTVSGTTKTTVTVDMIVNDECSDFGLCVFEEGTQPEWEWGPNLTRLAAQYDCTQPTLTNSETEVGSTWGLPGPGTYRVRFTYDPNNAPNLKLETLDTADTVLDTLTLDGILNPGSAYKIGFAADQDSDNLRTYIKHLSIVVDGGNTYSDSLLLSGSADRLINGSQEVVLNTNGSTTFPGNISLNGGTIFGGSPTEVVTNANITNVELGNVSNNFPVVVTFDTNAFYYPIRGTVVIANVATPAEINGTWYFEAWYNNQLSLFTDDTFTVSEFGTGWSAWTSGGDIDITINDPATDVKINSGGYETTFSNDGSVILSTTPDPTMSTIVSPFNSGILLNAGGNSAYVFSENGNLIIPGIINSDNGIQLNSPSGINVLANGITGLEIDSGNVNVFANNINTWTFQTNGNLDSATAANISTTGNISAGYFIGNGSQLTNLPSASSQTHSVFGVDYTASANDDFIFVYNNGVPICTVSLPATAQDGKTYTIKKMGPFGGWTVRLNTVGGTTTIDDSSANIDITAAYGYLTVVYSSAYPGYWITSQKIS